MQLTVIYEKQTL